MTSSPSLSIAHFKECVSQFATGVAVVTTSHRDRLYGITVSSFASVSLHPPLISFNLIRKGSKHRIFSNAESFVVHILSDQQESVSRLFAKSSSRESEQFTHAMSALGNPILPHTLAHMECRNYAVHEAGDHSILLGEVLNVVTATQRKPLLYFRSNYTTF